LAAQPAVAAAAEAAASSTIQTAKATGISAAYTALHRGCSDNSQQRQQQFGCSARSSNSSSIKSQ
jgi:hypothetical protein